LTYPDWQEPVRLLELSIGLSTPAQRALADQFGLTLGGDEPRGILGVMLEERILPLIWDVDTAPEIASERQRNFLRTLGIASAANCPALTKRLASAWIDHQLTIRTIESLRRLQIRTGDAVIKRTVWRRHLPGIPPHETFEICYVSSIGANGMVYFKGGNGSCGWPSLLYRAGPEDEPSAYPQDRIIADK
jgi:hypothetical protein